MNKDLEHLRLLSIFHYVVGVIVAIFACIPIIHLTIGLMFLTGNFPEPPHKANEPEFPVQLFGVMFTIIPLILIIGGWALAIATFIAGRKLSKHQGYTFCLVVAGILCTFAPFGTVLGVFTLIVLLRDSVKQIFNGQNSSTRYTPQSWQQ